MVKFCSTCGAQAVDDTSLCCTICRTEFPANIPKKKIGSCQNCDPIIPLPDRKNGSPWIEEVRAAHMINPAKPVELKKSRINTSLILIVGSILFSLILLGIIFPPNDNYLAIIFPQNDNSSGSSPVIHPTPTPDPASTLSESKALEILNLPVGGGASDGIKSVMVFSAKKTNQYSYYSETLKKNQVETAPPGKVFIIVDAEIKNTGVQTLNASSASFGITDSGGYNYDPHIPYYGNDGLTMQQLYLNQQSKGKVLFVIPAISNGLKLQYKFRDTVNGPQLAAWLVT
jgi:hypothetical protein